MPSSGELRLRTFTLALIALGGIWIALVIQRGHHAPAASFAAGPQPADFAPPKARPGKGSQSSGRREPRRERLTARQAVHAGADETDPRRPDPRRLGEVRSEGEAGEGARPRGRPADRPLLCGDGYSAARNSGDLRRTGRRRHFVEREHHVEDEPARADAGRVRPRRTDDLVAAERRQPRRPPDRSDRPRVLDDLPGLPARGRRVEQGADVDGVDHDSADGKPKRRHDEWWPDRRRRPAFLPDGGVGPVLRRVREQHRRRHQPLHGRRLQQGRHRPSVTARRPRLLDRERGQRRLPTARV